MSTLTRRSFIHKTLAAAGALATLPHLSFTEVSGYGKSANASDLVELGKTGINVSRVAMGTGFNGGKRESNQTRMGQKSFTELMRHGFDNGVCFYDMADLYGTHPYMKNTLKEIPRDKVVLLSKLWYMKSDEVMTGTDRAIPEVDRFRKELDVDVLDICLIHCLMNGTWKEDLKRIRDELAELKQKGVVRAVGCSCHNFEALKIASQDPWVDIIFARINNAGKIMDDTPENVAAVLKNARANGKAVVGMKIYGAGNLVEKEQRDSSLRYVWGNHLVDAMTIGFEKTAQVDDTMEHLTTVLRG